MHFQVSVSHWGITSIPCLFITTSVYCCFEVVCFLFVLLSCQATCPFFGEMISFCSCGHCVFWRLHVGTGTTLKSPMLFLFALQSTVIVASMDGTLLIYSISLSLSFPTLVFFSFSLHLQHAAAHFSPQKSLSCFFFHFCLTLALPAYMLLFLEQKKTLISSFLNVVKTDFDV